MPRSYLLKVMHKLSNIATKNTKNQDKIMKKSHDLGIIIVLLERFQKQRLPRILKIKEKVDNGQCLEELDIEFLKVLFADAKSNLPLLHRHTEYDYLAGKITFLYHEITEKALQNQNANGRR